MKWFKPRTLYSIPDEAQTFGCCSLHKSVIEELNNKHDYTNFKDIPNTLRNEITTYTNELFGDISDFETKYRKLRNEFKSIVYSYVIDNGVECMYMAYDKGDPDGLNDFLEPRAITETYEDDEEEIQISCYDDIVEHIRYSHDDCPMFKGLFINYKKTIEELVLIFYTSIQDYFDYKMFYRHISPEHYTYINEEAPYCLYYTTEYDSDYDDDDEFDDFVDEIHENRALFFHNYNKMCVANGVFDKYYTI